MYQSRPAYTVHALRSEVKLFGLVNLLHFCVSERMRVSLDLVGCKRKHILQQEKLLKQSCGERKCCLIIYHTIQTFMEIAKEAY